jgi:hypothetical protein
MAQMDPAKVANPVSKPLGLSKELVKIPEILNWPQTWNKRRKVHSYAPAPFCKYSMDLVDGYKVDLDLIFNCSFKYLLGSVSQDVCVAELLQFLFKLRSGRMIQSLMGDNYHIFNCYNSGVIICGMDNRQKTITALCMGKKNILIKAYKHWQKQIFSSLQIGAEGHFIPFALDLIGGCSGN